MTLDGRRAWHARLPTPEERGAQLAAEGRAARARRRRRLFRAAGGMLGSVAIGLGLMGWAVHTTDQGWGQIAFWSGLLVGNVGWLASAVWLHASAVEDGDL